jgi:hypothetical protein
MATKAASKRVRVIQPCDIVSVSDDNCHLQLGKESQMMVKDSPPYCFARPREDNILEW